MTLEDSATAVILANLRGDFGKFARDIGEIKTALAVLVERSNRTEEDVKRLREDTEGYIKQLRQDTENQIKELKSESETSKRFRWMAAGAGSAVGVVATSAAQFFIG